MSMKKFWEDKKEADKVEELVGRTLKKKFQSIKSYEFNDDNKYDIKAFFGHNQTKTFEIKADKMVQWTGNVGIEFFNRGKKSGISVSQADYYVYHLTEAKNKKSIYIIPTQELKSLIKKNQYDRIVNAGDGKLAKCYLFNLRTFKQHARLLSNVA